MAAKVDPEDTDVIATNLERLIVEGDYNYEDVARAAGLDQSTLYRIRHRQCAPTVRTLRRLAVALGVEAAEFYREP